MAEAMDVQRRVLYSVENSTSSAWVTLFWAMGYNLIMLVVVLLSYGLGHRWPFWRRMIAPRNAVGERRGFTKPFYSLWRTLIQVIRTTEEELTRKSGVDASSYIRFFAMCIQLFVILNITVLPLLLAFYSQGANPNGVTGIAQLTLSNLLNQSNVIWVSLAALYWVTLITCLLCWRHTVHVVGMRRGFLMDSKRALEPHNYATIVTCIPGPEDDLFGPVAPKSGAKAENTLSFALAMILDLWHALKDVGKFFLIFFPCFHSVGTASPATMGWKQRPCKEEAELLLPEAGATVAPEAIVADVDSASSGNGNSLNDTVDQGNAKETLHKASGLIDAGPGAPEAAVADGATLTVTGGEACGCPFPGQKYAQPGEPGCPPYMSNFFLSLFGDQLLHLQPVYSEALVAKAYTRWRHALRMLNESRMDWEAAREAAARATLEKSSAEGKGGKEEEGGVVGKNGSQGSPESPADIMPRHKVGKKMLFFGGQTVESIPFWIAEVKAAAKELEAAQERALQRPLASAVIAIFKTRRAAALCREALSAKHGNWTWKAMQASPAHEMWWDNLRYTTFKDTVRTFWATFMTICMIVFFYIPVTLIASLASGKAVGTAIGGQKEAVDSSWLPPFLQSIVPSLALHSVLWIFSPVFMVIARWEGRISLPDAQIVSSSRFYYCVVINVLIAYTLTTSLFTEIVNVVNRQVTVTELFATGIPANAAFYIQYTLNTSLMCGMELGRLPVHIVGYLIKRWSIGTAKCDRERHWDQGPMAYQVFIGYSNLIMTFGIVYAVIAPLILPFSLLYCLIAYCTWKHEVMHVYKDPVDRGGVYWIRLMHHLRNALFIGQMTAVGVFGLKQAYTQMGLAFLAVPHTLAFFAWITVQYGPFFTKDTLDGLVYEEVAEDGALAAQDPATLASYYFPVWMRPPVLPNLDPLAPSDPDIWHHMHPTRCLFVTSEYFPTPTAALKGQGQEQGKEEGAAPVCAPEDPNERAFWELTNTIPRAAETSKEGRKRAWHRKKKGAAPEEHADAPEVPAPAKEGDKES